jgi:ring hydroxylating enzyme alpha subunit
VTFPYRKIDELRGAPPEQRSTAGVLTYVYHLFPNVIVATFPFNTAVIVHEPLAVGLTKVINYSLTDGDESDEQWQHGLKCSLDFQQSGANEDRDVCVSIQRGLASGANEFLEFGRFDQSAVGGAQRHSAQASANTRTASRSSPVRQATASWLGDRPLTGRHTTSGRW